MEIQFRRFSTEDKEEVLDMMEAFYRIDTYLFVRITSEKNLLEFIATDTLGRLYVIVYQQNIVGYIVMSFSFSFEFKGRNAFIDELYIKDDYRNQGIGKKALIFIEEEAKVLKVNALHMEVERHNTNAHNLYLKAGFTDNNRTLLTKFMTPK